MTLRVGMIGVCSFWRQHAAGFKELGCQVAAVADVSGELEAAALARELSYDLVLLSMGGLGDSSKRQLLEHTARVGEVMPKLAVGGRKLGCAFWREFTEDPEGLGHQDRTVRPLRHLVRRAGRLPRLPPG